MTTGFLLVVPNAAMAFAVAGTVDTGGEHVCALSTTGAAYCWGMNNDGQLGNGTTTNSLVPVAVSGGHTFVALSSGGRLTCAIDNSDAAWCWGNGSFGALGDGNGSHSSVPVAVAGGHSFTDISAGDGTVCAIDSSNDAWCWGVGYYGGIGDGNTTDRTTPRAVTGGHDFTTIATESRHVCAITTSNAAYCWGQNSNGQVGNGNTTQQNSPAAVTGGLSFSTLSTGEDHTCAITTAHAGYCWGYGGQGQMGNGGTSGDNTSPVSVTGGLLFDSIASGRKASCAITSSDLAYCWGTDSSGFLGNGGTNVSVSSPTATSFGYSWSVLSMSTSEFACGVSTVGSVYCWGSNSDGHLGDGTTTNHDTPQLAHFSAEIAGSTVGVIVDPSLSLAVAGYNSGTCNGVTIDTTGSTGTAVALNPTPIANKIGGQTLTVSTNASGGFTVYVRSTGALTKAGGATIADWTGTNASPTAFPAAGTAAFGYSTDHALSGTSTRFQSDKWAGFTTVNAEVSYAASGPVSSDVAHVCMQSGISSTTAAGEYSTTLTYTALPTF